MANFQGLYDLFQQQQRLSSRSPLEQRFEETRPRRPSRSPLEREFERTRPRRPSRSPLEREFEETRRRQSEQDPFDYDSYVREYESERIEDEEGYEIDYDEPDAHLDDIGRSEDPWADDYEILEERLPRDDNETRDDEQWAPWDDDPEVLGPWQPLGWDEYQRLTGPQPPRGGLPDDPNETRDDEQWDAWGAPKAVAGNPYWDEYQRLTGRFPRRSQDPWGDDPEVLVDEEDLKAEYDALSTEAGNLADAALQSFWNVLGATDEGEDLSWTVDTASDRMALSFYSGAEGAIAYFVGSTKDNVSVLERKLYEAARPEVEEQVRNVLIGLTSDSQATINLRWVHRGDLPLMWLEIRFWGARRDVGGSPSDANETRDDQQWDAWGAPKPAGKAVADDFVEQMDPGVSGPALTAEEIADIYYAKQGADPLSLTFLEYDIVYGRLRPDFAGGPRVGGGDTGGPGGRLPQQEAGDEPEARRLEESTSLLPDAWVEALLEAGRLGADIFSISQAWADVPPGMILHPHYPNIFLDSESLLPYHYKDGELKQAPWNYGIDEEWALPDGRIKKGKPFEEADPQFSDIRDRTTASFTIDEIRVRTLRDDELTWLPEFVREYVFVNVETEKYVDPNGRELFLWPWENRLRVEEGEGDAWLYQFLEYLLAPELTVLGMLGVEFSFTEDPDISEQDVEFYIKKYKAGGYDYFKNLPEHGKIMTDYFKQFDEGKIDSLVFAAFLRDFDKSLGALEHDVRGDISFESLDMARLGILQDWAVEQEQTLGQLRPDQVVEYISRWNKGEFQGKLGTLYESIDRMVREGQLTQEELAVYLYIWETMEERKVRREYGLAETEQAVRDDPILIAQYMERIKLGDFDELLARQLKTGDRAAEWSALPDEDKAAALWRWEAKEAEKGRGPTITLVYDESQVITDAENLAQIAKDVMWEHAAGHNTEYQLGPRIGIQEFDEGGRTCYRIVTASTPPSQLPSPEDFGEEEAKFGDDFHKGEDWEGRDLDSLEAQRRARKERLTVWREMERYRVGVEIAMQVVQETRQTLPTRQRLFVRGYYLDVVPELDPNQSNDLIPVFTPSDYQRDLAERTGYEFPKRVLWGVEVCRWHEGVEAEEVEPPDSLGAPQVPSGRTIEIKSEEELEAEEEEERAAGKAVVSDEDGKELTPEIIDKIYYANMDADPLSLTFLEYDIVYGRLRPAHAGGPRVGGGDTGGPGGRLPQQEADDDPVARLLAQDETLQFEKIGDSLYYYDTKLTLWFGITAEGETFMVGTDKSMELVRQGGTTQEVGREIDPETGIRLGGSEADFYPNPGLYIDNHYYYYDAAGAHGGGPGWYGEFENTGDGSTLITRATRVAHGGMIAFRINIIAPPRTQLPDDSTPAGRIERAALFNSLPNDVYYNPLIGEFVRSESNGQHLIQRDWTEFVLGETREKAITVAKRNLGYDPYMLYGQDVGPEFIYADAEMTYELQGEPYFYDETIDHWVTVRADGQKIILTGGPPPGYYYNDITGISFYQADDGRWYGRTAEGVPVMTDDTGFPIDPETGELIDWQKPVNVRVPTAGQPYYFDEGLGLWVIANPNLPRGYEFSFRPPEGYYYNSITKLAFYQGEGDNWYGVSADGRMVRTDDTGFPIDLAGNPVDWQEEGWLDTYWSLPANEGVEAREGWLDQDLGDYIPEEGLTGTITLVVEDAGPADDSHSPRSQTAADALFLAEQIASFAKKETEEKIEQERATLLREIAELKRGETGWRQDKAAFQIEWRAERLQHLSQPITITIRWFEGEDNHGEQVGYEIFGTGGILAGRGAIDDVEDNRYLVLASVASSATMDSFLALLYQEREERLEALEEKLGQSLTAAGGMNLPKYNIGRGAPPGSRIADANETGEVPIAHVWYRTDKWEEPLGYDPNAFARYKDTFDDALTIARAVQEKMVRVLREEKATHLTTSIITKAVRGPHAVQPDDAEEQLAWFGYSVGSFREELSNESFYAYDQALYEGAKEADALAESLSPGLIKIGIGGDALNGLESVNIFALASIHIDIIDFDAPPQPFPEDKPLPTGEEHSEFDPGFDLPEIGDALYIAEYVADMIRTQVRLSQMLSAGFQLEDTIVVRPEYANEGIRYLIGSNSSAANDAPEYTAAIQAALIAANEVAQSRGVAEFMTLNLSSIEPSDDPSNTVMAIEIWFGLEFDEASEAWRAVRPRGTSVKLGDSSRLRNAAMKDVVDFAVRLLKQECPVRTGTMRNSVSARPTDHSYKGNISTYWDVGARVQYSRFVASYRSAVDRALAATQAYAAQYDTEEGQQIVVHPALIELPMGGDKYGAPFGPGMVIEFGEAQGGFWKDFHFGPGSFDLIHPNVVNWLFGTDLQPGDLTPPGLPGSSWDYPDEVVDEEEYDDDDTGDSDLPFRLRG